MLVLEKKKKVKKRGRGRPKKRGPKKKKKYVSKVVKPSKMKKYDYKIVSVSNGRQDGYIGKYYSIEMAYKKLEELKKENSVVVFPKKYTNYTEIKGCEMEYLLLKKNRDGNLSNSMLRNEFGKLIEHVSSNLKWIIYDKCEKKVEETFWVYGFCPKTNRKTFKWIYDSLIKGGLKTNYDIERILIYKNKIIIKYDNKEMNIILCKNMSDAMRFYNLLKEWCKRDRQIFFIGSYDDISEKRRVLEREIMDYTGWSKIKVQRSSTRP